MKERPIIFSGEQVRALLDGTKTQTRRVIKLRHSWSIEERDDGSPWPWHPDYVTGGEWDGWAPCPYGRPGDRLWVRETFIHEPADYCWEASVSIPCSPATTVYRADYEGDTHGGHWTPSIYMPRRASRILLEITDVRVHRLQDISEEDAIAEGCKAATFPGPWWQGYKDCGDGELIHQQAIGEQPPAWMIEPKRMRDRKHLDNSAKDAFRGVWESINGAGSWDANPWVWALTFRRVRP